MMKELLKGEGVNVRPKASLEKQTMVELSQGLVSKLNQNRSALFKGILFYFFFPVAFPLILFRLVRAFREKFGFKQRALEGKVRTR
jgi:hypothetical protein